MVRWLRFALYSGFLIGALAPSGAAIRQSLRVLLAPAFFAPAVPCIPCALVMLVAASAYAVWLGGATVAGWRMPLFTHLIPLSLVAFTLIAGPLRTPAEAGAGGVRPSDRALEAMRRVSAEIERTGRNPCAPEADAALANLVAGSASGYRSHGRVVPFRLERRAGNGPMKALEAGAGPGTLYVTCSEGRFWMSAVVTETVPTGSPTLVRDGVGKVAVLTGRFAQ